MRSKQMLSAVLSLSMMTTLAGCSIFAEQEETPPSFDTVVIRNLAPNAVHEVGLTVPGVEVPLLCGTIPAEDSCTSGIAQTAFSEEAFKLDWQYAGPGQRTMPLVLAKPADFGSAGSYVAVIEFNNGGILSAYWQEQE